MASLNRIMSKEEEANDNGSHMHAQRFDTQLVMWFEQYEPLIENQVVKVELGNEQNPKSIFIG